MKIKILGAVSIVLGVGLLAFSIVWPSLEASQSKSWTPEMAQRRQELIQFLRGGGGEFFPKDKRMATREFDQLTKKLQDAKEAPARTAAIAKWTGIGLTAIGIAVYYTRQKKHGKRPQPVSKGTTVDERRK